MPPTEYLAVAVAGVESNMEETLSINFLVVVCTPEQGALIMLTAHIQEVAAGVTRLTVKQETVLQETSEYTMYKGAKQ